MPSLSVNNALVAGGIAGVGAAVIPKFMSKGGPALTSDVQLKHSAKVGASMALASYATDNNPLITKMAVTADNMGMIEAAIAVSDGFLFSGITAAVNPAQRSVKKSVLNALFGAGCGVAARSALTASVASYLSIPIPVADSAGVIIYNGPGATRVPGMAGPSA